MASAGNKRKSDASASVASSDSDLAPSSTSGSGSLASNKKKKHIKKSEDGGRGATGIGGGGRASTSRGSGGGGGGDDDNNEESSGHVTLSQIASRISSLRSRVPPLPPSGQLDPTDVQSVTSWAKSLHSVIEECNLLLCLVSSATYRWGTDRSGAADQNLALLSGELSSAQDQIGSGVAPKLSNVLCPVVDLVVERTISTKKKADGDGRRIRRAVTVTERAEGEEPISKNAVEDPGDPRRNDNDTERDGANAAEDGDHDGDEEVKLNVYSQQIVDPDYVRLSRESICRNASLLRQVVLASFRKMERVIHDYEKATKKDAQHDGATLGY